MFYTESMERQNSAKAENVPLGYLVKERKRARGKGRKVGRGQQ